MLKLIAFNTASFALISLISPALASTPILTVLQIIASVAIAYLVFVELERNDQRRKWVGFYATASFATFLIILFSAQEPLSSFSFNALAMGFVTSIGTAMVYVVEDAQRLFK